MREPDWDALSDLQFILYQRIAGALNEALSSIALSGAPEAQDRPPGFWQDRAADKIANVLNLFTAWSYLVQYKVDRAAVERTLRPFPINSLLAWLARQLQLSPAPRLASDPLLHANQETLQEALLLLYSAAYTYGGSVRLELEASRLGVWFHLKFKRHAPLPTSYDALLAAPDDHWRAQQTAFELASARDFLRLNGSDVALGASDSLGEFLFFVRAAGVPTHRPPPTPARALPAAAPAPAPSVASPALEQTIFERLTGERARLLAEIERAASTPDALRLDDKADTLIFKPGDAARTPPQE